MIEGDRKLTNFEKLLAERKANRESHGKTIKRQSEPRRISRFTPRKPSPRSDGRTASYGESNPAARGLANLSR